MLDLYWIPKTATDKTKILQNCVPYISKDECDSFLIKVIYHKNSQAAQAQDKKNGVLQRFEL